MKEFIEKLIGRLEEEKNKRLLFEDNATEEEAAWYFSGSRNGLADAIEIVNQLAEEYKHCALCYLGSPCEYQNENAELPNELLADNNDWIPCSERLPEENGEYYTYVYYDGHYMYSIDEIDCDAIVKEWNCSSDYKIIAWKPIAPYQPKGE